MASYFTSYFGTGTGAGGAQSQQYQQQYQQPYQGQPQAQSSSTWAGTFSSRVAGLRKALTRDDEEDDSENEDCSHVSNVLRAYYTEKGRPFPEWLPPDPRKPAVTPAVQQPSMGQYGNMYPGQYGNNTGMPHSRGNSGGRGGLSDLWDSGPPSQQPVQAQSLRAPRPTPQSLRSFDSATRQDSFESTTPNPRLLPSQRAGSQQNLQSSSNTPPVLGSRDRLRARLQGGNSGRSSPANVPQTGYPGNDGGSYQPTSQPRDNAQYAGYEASTPGYGNQPYQSKYGGYGR